MSTPRKRRRVDDGEDQAEQISKDELQKRGVIPTHPDSGTSDPQLDLASPKKRSLNVLLPNELDKPHQYAADAPSSSSQAIPQTTKHGIRNAPRSPGPGFITSSPMNKKSQKTAALATRGAKLPKPARRLSDEFNAIAAEGSPSAPISDPTHASSSQSDITRPSESTSRSGSAADTPQNSQTQKHNDSPLHSRHASLNHPHGDEVDEHNASVMDSIFSPGLRSFVTQKFHALTSSLGVRSSQEIERDPSLSQSSNAVHQGFGHHQTYGNVSHSSGQLSRSLHLPHPDTTSTSRVQLPMANGIHHAAYRRRPHHNLSPTHQTESTATSSAPFPSNVPSIAPRDSSLSQSTYAEEYEIQDTKGSGDQSISSSQSGMVPIEEGKTGTTRNENLRSHSEAQNQRMSQEAMKTKVATETGPSAPTVGSPEPRHRKKSRSRIPVEEEVQEEEFEEEEASGKGLKVVREIEEGREEATEELGPLEALEEEVGEEEIADDVSEEEFDSYLFMANVPPLASLVPAVVAPPGLPMKTRHAPKVTLVLDLDETLVHCSLEKIDNPDLIFAVSFEGEEYQVYVRKRPGFEEFLTRVSELFEVAVFTASQKAYADKLLNILDPEQRWIHHRLFRESCIFVLGNYLKDLNVLGRDMSKVIIVDNSPHVFAYQLDNGIPIESWYDDSRDRELLNLLPFLETLANCNDVRPLVRGRYQVHKKVEDSLRAYHELASLARAKHLLPSIIQNDTEIDHHHDHHHHHHHHHHHPSSTDTQDLKSNRSHSRSGSHGSTDDTNPNERSTERSNTSLVEGDTDDDGDQRTTPVKPSRRKARVRSRIPIAQYESDSDLDPPPSASTASKRR
jgi:CTD small phosphatase-like protein 2